MTNGTTKKKKRSKRADSDEPLPSEYEFNVGRISVQHSIDLLTGDNDDRKMRGTNLIRNDSTFDGEVRFVRNSSFSKLVESETMPYDQLIRDYAEKRYNAAAGAVMQVVLGIAERDIGMLKTPDSS